jgi:hypothetical protein
LAIGPYDQTPSAGAGSPRTRGGPTTAGSTIAQPVAPAGVPLLCEVVGALMETRGADVYECHLDALGDAETDAGTLETVARVALSARRLGRQVRLVDAPPMLRDLIELAGLAEVLPCECRSGVEARRQPEQREEAGSVEEEGDAADAVP